MAISEYMVLPDTNNVRETRMEKLITSLSNSIIYGMVQYFKHAIVSTTCMLIFQTYILSAHVFTCQSDPSTVVKG